MKIPEEYFIFKISVLKKILIITLVISTTALVLAQKGFALGFLTGGLLSGAIFSLLYKYVLQIRNFSVSKRKRFLLLRSFAIYAIMALALLIGIKKGIPAFLGTALGLLSLKAAVFMQAFGEKHAGT